MHGDFVWVDLSALQFRKAKSFYQKVFGWQWYNDGQYTIGYLPKNENLPAAGIYPMPKLFRKIKMPSFWMGYIQVDDVQLTKMKAEQLGARIELEEENDFGRIVLIRDPAGAGFTVYQGDALQSKQTSIEPNRWMRSELFVNSLIDVEPFYKEMFGWSLRSKAGNPNRFDILNSVGTTISFLNEASEGELDGKVYWAVFFGVKNLDKAERLIQKHGGQCDGAYAAKSGSPNYLVYDPQGSFFYIEQIES